MDGSETTPTRVLVVDDERNITDLVTMALRYEGFAVESASDRDSQLVRLPPGRPTP
jgi:DNA-binding response OmpR family regulator